MLQKRTFNSKTEFVLWILLCLPFFIGGSLLNAQTNSLSKDTVTYRDFKTEHMWDAKVKVANMIVVGESKNGVRRVIPITGGTFEGPKIKGVILPVGADWQLVRHDGDVELNARYLMKTEDGVVFQVINRVLIHMSRENEKPASYIKSVLELEAPNDSQYDYMNHSIFIGTLTTPAFKAGEEPYVIIGVYRLL